MSEPNIEFTATFLRLHEDGGLDSFIEELEDIQRKQKEAIARHESKEFLSAVVERIEIMAEQLEEILKAAKEYRSNLRK